MLLARNTCQTEACIAKYIHGGILIFYFRFLAFFDGVEAVLY